MFLIDYTLYENTMSIDCRQTYLGRCNRVRILVASALASSLTPDGIFNTPALRGVTMTSSDKLLLLFTS